MNATLLGAIVLLALWIVLAFVLAVPSGWVHVCYAGSTILVARRIVVGAPSFRS